MARRKRKEPTLTEKLAAALAMLLPNEQYKALHGDRLLEINPVSAETVIRLFTFDHDELHAHGGADTWDNLTPRLRGAALKAKDIRDTKIAAKSKRIIASMAPVQYRWKDLTIDGLTTKSGPILFTNQTSERDNGIYTVSVKPKRKIPKGPKLQSRNTLRRSNAKVRKIHHVRPRINRQG